MTDQELSTLLREWKSTPAPETLDNRVFARRVPMPWWERLPGTPVAAFGALAGVLIVWSLSVLAPRDPAPPPPPAVQQPTEPKPAIAVPVAPLTPSRPKATRPKPAQTTVAPPPPAPSTPAPSVQPRLLVRIDPNFPPDTPPALMRSIFKLRVHIGKDGHVMEAMLVAGDPTLGDLAVEAVKQWLYAPKLENGEPVEVFYEIEVSFSPRPRPAKAIAR